MVKLFAIKTIFLIKSVYICSTILTQPKHFFFHERLFFLIQYGKPLAGAALIIIHRRFYLEDSNSTALSDGLFFAKATINASKKLARKGFSTHLFATARHSPKCGKAMPCAKTRFFVAREGTQAESVYSRRIYR